MVNCPKCQAPLPDDFGLVECGKCAAPLFIELDGTVRESGGANAPGHKPVGMELVDIEAAAAASVGGAQPPPLEGSFMKKIDPRLINRAGQVQNPEPQPMEPPEPVASTAATAATSDLGTTRLVELSDAEAGPYQEQEQEISVSDLSDVTAYGNSEISRGQDGGLLYNLRVEGIDSVELRVLVKEILEDRKFLWDSEALLKSIRMGILVLRDVSPVKAALLVQRLHDLPVNVTWEQHAIHEA